MLGIAYVMEPGEGWKENSWDWVWYGVDMVDYRGEAEAMRSLG